MKKLFAFLHGLFSSGTGKIIIDVAANTAISKGGDLLEEGLNDFYAKSPQSCSAMVASLYVWVDTSLEDLAAKSGTDYDDKAVDAVKAELEKFAAAKGFALTNLDAGTPND